MSGIAVAIMDAAERRIRIGGFNGFSFREIAADVGIRSSSVHYHFPTKEDLAAAVVRRYTDALSKTMDERIMIDPNPFQVWTKAFRGTAGVPGDLCPCTVLGAGSQDLPPQVAVEVKRFFNTCLAKLVTEGIPRDEAAELLSTLTGATILAAVTGDAGAYDRATSSLLRAHEKGVAAG